MDKNGARGRAHKTVSNILKACLRLDMIKQALQELASSADIAAVEAEIQDIADEHARQADHHRAIEWKGNA